jgi:hypothetical protein
MAEVKAQRSAAEARLGQGTRRPRLTAGEITRIVSSLRDLISGLADADPADKAEIYGQLGLALTYHPGEQKVRAQARPWEGMHVSKCPRGESPLTYMPAIIGELVLGVSDERGSGPVDQVNDDRVHAEDARPGLDRGGPHSCPNRAWMKAAGSN